MREHTASESTDGLIASPSHRSLRALALPSENTPEGVAHAPRSADGPDGPNVPRKSTLSSFNHSDGLMKMDGAEPAPLACWARATGDSWAGAALPTDTSMPSDVSEPNRIVPVRMLYLRIGNGEPYTRSN